MIRHTSSIFSFPIRSFRFFEPRITKSTGMKAYCFDKVFKGHCIAGIRDLHHFFLGMGVIRPQTYSGDMHDPLQLVLHPSFFSAALQNNLIMNRQVHEMDQQEKVRLEAEAGLPELASRSCLRRVR
jgi:hypothetical protein